MTVKKLAAEYIERHAIPNKKPSNLKQDRQMLKAHVLPTLGDHEVSAVRRPDVEKVLDSCPGRRIWPTASGVVAPHILDGRPVEPAARQSLRRDQALPLEEEARGTLSEDEL